MSRSSPAPRSKPPQWMRIARLAEHAGLHYVTVRHAAHCGKFKTKVIGGVLHGDLVTFMAYRELLARLRTSFVSTVESENKGGTALRSRGEGA